MRPILAHFLPDVKYCQGTCMCVYVILIHTEKSPRIPAEKSPRIHTKISSKITLKVTPKKRRKLQKSRLRPRQNQRNFRPHFTKKSLFFNVLENGTL